jgi:beta-lactamase regulating signal transducer with metallopeptidase domain
MTQFMDRASFDLVSELLTSAVRSVALAGIAAAALAAFRVRATSLRLFTWTSVLYASFALPVLAGLLPPLQVRTPQFLQHGVAPNALGNVAIPATHLATNGAGAKRPGNYRPETASHNLTSPGTQNIGSESASSSRFTIPWYLPAAAIYVAVTLIFLARFTVGILFSHKLVRNSQAITRAFAIAKVVFPAGRPIPRLAASEYITVPVTVGVFRPTILLPSGWREWDSDKLHAVLAHELSHVARRDTLTQCISLLYRAVFWFHPLAWWLQRHLSELAEQASDEAALSCGADQKHYARTLLDFFDALQTTPGRVRWQGVSMARVGQAERRLERILAWKGTVVMNVKRSLAAAILVLAVPVVYLAASVRPGNPEPAVSQQPVAPAVPAAAPVASISGAPAIAGAPSAVPAPPVPAIAGVAPVAPMALVGPAGLRHESGQHYTSGTVDGNGFFYSYGDDEEERFVIASGKTDAFTMSGSTQDVRHVEKLKKQIPGDFIWFQRDEKSYIIRDQATIDRARAFWAPQEELGKKQEELGKQQEELGKQQEEMGKKMEQVKVNVPDMTAALDRLKAKLQKLGPTATMEQIGELQSEIGELQSKIGEIQSQAGEQQGKLGELQGELGEKQGKLGEQQGELGRQQGELAEKATRQMRGLLDEAIKNGTAKPEEDVAKNPRL